MAQQSVTGTSNETVVVGTSEQCIMAMVGYPIGIGVASTITAFEIAFLEPGTGNFGGGAGHTCRIDPGNRGEIGIVNDGTHNILVRCDQWNSGLWRYIENASASAATTRDFYDAVPLFLGRSRSCAKMIGVESVPVNRAGGASGSASVICKTVNNTAVAGVDFTAVTQTLTWASGDTAPKNCAIPISNKTPFSATRNFFIELSGPSGATLGAITKSTVTISGDSAKQHGRLIDLATDSVKQERVGSLTITVTSATGNERHPVQACVGCANSPTGSAIEGKDYTRDEWEIDVGTPATGLLEEALAIPISNAGPPSAAIKLWRSPLPAPQGLLIGMASATVTVTGDRIDYSR